MPHARSSLVAALAALAIGWGAGCAAATRGTEPGRENYVAAAELAETNSRTVYDALEKVRPQWLTSRGAVSVRDPSPATANVYMNGAYVGELDYLRQVYIIDVAGLRFWSAAEAGVRFGMGNPRGVIEIVTRR